MSSDFITMIERMNDLGFGKEKHSVTFSSEKD